MTFNIGPTVIGIFNTPGVTLKRRSTPTYSNGFASASTTTTSSLVCSWHTLSDKELAVLPEGQRTSGAIYVYTTTALQTADSSTGVLADVVTISNVDYEIHSQDAWSIQANYYRYLALRVPV